MTDSVSKKLGKVIQIDEERPLHNSDLIYSQAPAFVLVQHKKLPKMWENYLISIDIYGSSW